LITMDPEGQEAAREVGIELKDIRSLKAGRVGGMDLTSKPKTEPVWAPPVYSVSTESLPRYQEPTVEVVDQGVSKVGQAPAASLNAVPVQQQELQTPLETIRPKPQREKSSSLGKFAFFSIVIALLIALALVIFILPEAKVTVFAPSIPVQSTVQLTADQTALVPDLNKDVVPGVLVSKDIEFSKSFEATGKVDVGGKAGGRVQIYNFTGRTLRLNSSTTVLTIGEKRYRFDQDITNIIPTKTIPGSKDVDPSSLIPPVTIMAEEGGVDYQAARGLRAEISNESFGSNPATLYSVTSEPILGGDSRFSTVIMPQDIENASRQLLAAIKEQAQEQILQSEGLTLIGSGIRIDSQELTFDKKAGDTSINFDGQVKAHITALGYEHNTIRDVVKEKIASTLPKNEYLSPEQEVDIEPIFTSIDYDKGVGALTLNVKTFAGSQLDIKGISTKITGKNAEQIKEILLSDPDIEGVEIELSPFWVKSVPKYSGRVTVQQRLEP
jgi:hypothetical protein